MTAEHPPRCSVVSRDLRESLHGTASTVRGWLLLEQPGPWGADALTGSRLPAGLGDELTTRSARAGVRVLLIRRHGRGASPAHRACYLAYTGAAGSWLEHARLEEPGQVLDLDLDAVGQGRRQGLRPVRGPIFLACTHGRHDACCAERGRPLAAALTRAYRTQTWESSHIGGDRFAGNLLCFPHGIYFGRVEADEAVAVASAYARGRLSLRHYRGRSGQPFVVQAAEAYLRAAHSIDGVDDLRWTGTHRRGPEVEAVFVLPDGTEVHVRVRVRRSDPARTISCGHPPERPPAYDLVGIERR